eukprot:7321024-Alexandrium_andersonii.AAC.1
MSASLVGSEMCIRDRPEFCVNRVRDEDLITGACHVSVMNVVGGYQEIRRCLLYTSDAADDM